MSNNMGTNEQKVLGHALQSPYDVLTFLVGVKLRWLHGWGETWLNGPVSPLAISSRLGSTNLVTLVVRHLLLEAMHFFLIAIIVPSSNILSIFPFDTFQWLATPALTTLLPQIDCFNATPSVELPQECYDVVDAIVICFSLLCIFLQTWWSSRCHAGVCVQDMTCML